MGSTGKYSRAGRSLLKFTGKGGRGGGGTKAGRGGLGPRHLNSKDGQRNVVFKPHHSYQ